MFWKNAMKYPALIAGLIMFAIFIMDPKTKSWWQESVQGRYIPSTCKALKDRIVKKAPSEWTIECPETSRLLLKVEFDKEYKTLTELRTNIYRSMANTLKNFSLLANPETLQNLRVMEIYMLNDKMEVWGVTDGQAMVELKSKDSKRSMAEHLELTVKVKEKRK